MIRDFGEVIHLNATKKGAKEFAAHTHKRAESLLIKELAKARPEAKIFQEDKKNPPTLSFQDEEEGAWVISPLDGPTNFLHGVPCFGLSLAFKEKDVTASLIYDPLRDEMFWAHKGMGAFLNDQRLRVSPKGSLLESLWGWQMPSFLTANKTLNPWPFFEVLLKKTSGVRMLGSVPCHLAYMAAGRLEGVVLWEALPTESMAGLLIAQEAGGLFYDPLTLSRCGRIPWGEGLFFAINQNIEKSVADLCGILFHKSPLSTN